MKIKEMFDKNEYDFISVKEKNGKVETYYNEDITKLPKPIKRQLIVFCESIIESLKVKNGK